MRNKNTLASEECPLHEHSREPKLLLARPWKSGASAPRNLEKLRGL
jgi:hypothetical protein